MDEFDKIESSDSDEFDEVVESRVERFDSSIKRSRFSNLNITDYLVLICLLSIIIFSSIVMYQYYVNDIPVIDLKTEIFTFFGVELLAMASISVSNNVRK